MKSVVKCACVVGLHIYQDIGTVRELPLSMGVIAFTKKSGQGRNRSGMADKRRASRSGNLCGGSRFQ